MTILFSEARRSSLNCLLDQTLKVIHNCTTGCREHASNFNEPFIPLLFSSEIARWQKAGHGLRQLFRYYHTIGCAQTGIYIQHKSVQLRLQKSGAQKKRPVRLEVIKPVMLMVRRLKIIYTSKSWSKVGSCDFLFMSGDDLSPEESCA